MKLVGEKTMRVIALILAAILVMSVADAGALFSYAAIDDAAVKAAEEQAVDTEETEPPAEPSDTVKEAEQSLPEDASLQSASTDDSVQPAEEALKLSSDLEVIPEQKEDAAEDNDLQDQTEEEPSDEENIPVSNETADTDASEIESENTEKAESDTEGLIDDAEDITENTDEKAGDKIFENIQDSESQNPKTEEQYDEPAAEAEPADSEVHEEPQTEDAAENAEETKAPGESETSRDPELTEGIEEAEAAEAEPSESAEAGAPEAEAAKEAGLPEAEGSEDPETSEAGPAEDPEGAEPAAADAEEPSAAEAEADPEDTAPLNAEPADTETEPENPENAEPADPENPEADPEDPDAEHTEDPEAQEEPELSYPAFDESKVAGGVVISVSADEGVFPEGARLVVEMVPAAVAREAGEAVAEQRSSDQNVAVSYTFDIRVEDADGNELQPADGQTVRVVFALAEASDSNLEASVYHITEDGAGSQLVAEKLDAQVDEAAETVAAETSGFSLYTVEFTYKGLQYVMEGATELPLSVILAAIGISGTPSAVQTSNPALISTYVKNGEWIVSSHAAFSSTEWMKVTIDGVVYEITVTDAITNWVGLQSALSAGGTVTLPQNITAGTSDTHLEVPHGKTVTLDLKGFTINRNLSGSSTTDCVIKVYGTLTLKDSGSGGKITGGTDSGINIGYSNGSYGTFTMNGGTISGNSGTLGGGVSTGETIFTMTGGTISNNTAGNGGGVYSVGPVNMSGGTISNNTATSHGGGVEIQSDTFTMSGGTISGNTAPSGGGVYIRYTGTLAMSGGTISGNTLSGNGFGGGVYVYSDATLTMSGSAKISDNSAGTNSSVNCQGGGVYLEGKFTMNGGTISGNSAGTHGGGIHIGGSGTLTVSGGTISGNSAHFSGGGIALSGSDATLNLHGGSIKNNKCGSVGGGINYSQGTFNLKGAPTITGNTCGSSNSNVYCSGTINITGALTNTTKIGITTDTTPTISNGGVYFTSGLQSPGNATYDKFTSDSDAYYMGEYTVSGKKEAILKAKYKVTIKDPYPYTFNITDNIYIEYVIPGQSMTSTTITTASGYGLPTNYSVAAVSGVKVTRNSQTQLTVSGTPTANAEITLTDATILRTVNITAGANMTKTSGSGAASQTVIDGTAITQIVFNAATGYQFPENYSLPSKYGITVARTSASQITVSGTPTSNPVNITLGAATIIPATAPTVKTQPQSLTLTYGYTSGNKLSVAVNAISGHSISYQWQSKPEGGSWANISGATSSSYTVPTGGSVGTKYYRCVVKSTRTDNSQTATTNSSQATVTIQKKALTITAKDHSIIYGAAPANNGVTYSGFVNSETASALSGTLTYTYTYSQYGNVGSYTITPKGLTSSNYAITFNQGTLTVNKKNVTVSGITASNKVYDGTTNASLNTSNATLNGRVNNDNLTVSATGTFNNKDVGTNKNVAINNLKLGGTKAGNYQLASSGQQTSTTAAITKKAVAVSGITASNKVYDGKTTATLIYANAAFSGLVTGDTLNVTATGTFADKNVGTGKTVTISSLTLGGTSVGNYELGNTGNQTSTTVNITPKTVDLNWSNTSFTYNGSTQTPTATAGGVISGDTCTVSVTGGQKNAGSHTATASSLSNSNYQLPSANTKTFTISKAPLTVTAEAKSKTYGDSDPALNYTATGFKNGDTLSVMSGSLSRAEGENVGNYAINQGTVAAGDNYTISYTGATFTINKAPLTITADAKSKTYGDDDPELTYTVDGLKFSDTMSGNLTRETGEVFGSYAISQGTLTVSNSGNYDISYTGANLTIGTATLTVTAEAKSKTYGDSDPALTYTASGFKGTDTKESVMSGKLARAAGENYGTYAITQGDLSAGSNYIISYTGANLTINPATLVISAYPQTKTYGDPEPTLTYNYFGLKNSDTKDSVLSGALTRAPGEDVGYYEILQGTLAANSNYTISYTSANMQIKKATLTVTADAKSKTYGDADPALTYTASGFKGSDTKESVMSGALTRAAGEDFGTYAISQGTVSAGDNYTISYTGADLTIGKASLIVTADAKSKTYGDADPALTYTASGFKGSDTKESVMSGALARAAGEDFGTYAISQGTVSAGDNYTISYTGADLTIGKATLTVTAEAKSKTYGDADPALTYTASGFKRSDDESIITGALTRDAGNDAGTYAITQGTLDAGLNYNISYTGANLTINPATLVISAYPQTKTYGDPEPTFTYNYSGLKNSDTKDSVLSGTLTRAPGEDAGYYEILQGTLAANSNYTISYTSANMQIKKAALTITTPDDTKVYDGTALTAAGTITGLVNSETATIEVEGSQTDVGSSANDYSITWDGTAKAANYNIVTENIGTLTVTPAPLTITTPDAEKVYDGTALTAVGSITGLIGSETATMVAVGSQTDVGSSSNTYSITWDGTAKAANYSVTTENLGTLTVTKAPISITTPDASKVYDGAALTAVGSITGLIGTETATMVAVGSQTDVGSTSNTYSITWDGTAKAANYSVTTENLGTLTVTKAPISITTPDASKVYDGTALTAVGSITGLMNSETATIVAVGSQTDVGSSSNTYSITWDGTAKAANYSVTTENLGTLTVTKALLNVTTADASKVYDGTPVTATGTITGLMAGETATLNTTGSQTNAGSSSNTYSISWDGTAKAANYDITSETLGTLTITPDPLTVTTPSDTKVYDAAPLTAAGTLTGLVGAETATLNTTGSQTNVGSSTNTYSITWDGTAKAANYAVTTETLGVLTVTQYAGEIVVTTTGGSFVYDGTAHGATVLVSPLPAGYTLVAAASGASATDVTAAPVPATADTLVIHNASGVDVTDQLTITMVNDTISVTPAPLTVTTPDATKVYDGTALTSAGTLTGLIGTETATLNTTGTQTGVGSSTNSYSITWDGTAKAGNYKVTAETLGTLTVTEYGGAIVVTTTGGSFVYDGKPHGATVSVSALPAGYSVDTAGSSAAVTDVAEAVPVTADKLIIRNASGADVTAQLNIKKVDGTITVTPAPLSVVTPDASKIYDETPLTAVGTISGLVAGETVTFTATGTQTDVGSSANTYSLVWDGTAKAGNYALSEKLGTLTVTEVEYPCVEGSDATYTTGKWVNMRFRFKRNVKDEDTFGHFTGVKVDGKLVDPQYYEASPGSVIIDLKPAFLYSLMPGDHTLQALFDDVDSPVVHFTIVRGASAPSDDPPQTGDGNEILWGAAVIAVCAVGMIMARKKRRSK